ncbi:MCE family protein [Spirillospora sp. NPDC048911]|uniref:MCE family protein n=1 Tax=Spirillospora sp. NPDC048911 TaxID=3364527 RepID=UPI00371C91FE
MASGPPAPRTVRWIIAVGLSLMIVAGVLATMPQDGGRTITAQFVNSQGIYPNSDVRVLGVRIGKITSIRPSGQTVTVRMEITDDDVRIPAGVKAAVVSPNLVSDRYVQLEPAYTGGPTLASGGEIPVARTATPMELDQLYAALRKFTADLGPKGVNKNGALSEFLKANANNLKGNGTKLNQMIEDLGKASATLNHSADDFFGTMANFNKFTGMLRENDAEVREFQRRLADVSTFLAADRGNLRRALHDLGFALIKLKDFIHKNRKQLKGNVDKLADITKVLVDRRKEVAELFDVAPLAASNALNSYDPKSKTMMSRGNLLEITAAYGKGAGKGQGAVSVPVCTAGPRSKALKQACEAGPPGGLNPSPKPPVDAPPLPLPAAGPVFTGTSPAGGAR